MKKIKFLLALITLASLSGCAAVAIGGVGSAALGAHDRRTIGAVVDDQSIEFQASKRYSRINNVKGSHVNITSYNYTILLTGEVTNQQVGLDLEREVKTIPRVTKVHNELIVAQAAPATSVSNDVFITTKAKTALLRVKITGFDPTAVKIVTERGIVYLMGLVTREEANAVANEIQQVSGVQEIVKFFEYVAF